MAVTYLNSSTLSEALTKEQVEFAVGSTGSISVGDILVITDSVAEACKVRSIPVSGRVSVLRGVGGTPARVHVSGAKFWIGSPEKFKAIQESAVALVGSVSNLPDYMLPGQRARDARGNEFIMVDSTANVYSGVTIAISNDGAYTAAVLDAGVSQGAVGLMVEEATSDQWAWAQIYGYNAFAQRAAAVTGITSASLAMATTIVSTPSVGLDTTDDLTSAGTSAGNTWLINGMFIVGGGSSAVTSATSSVGYAVPVFLNYPWVSFKAYDSPNQSTSTA